MVLLTREESEVCSRYHRPGNSSMTRVPVNAIFISRSNDNNNTHEKHEQAKFNLAWQLMEMGHNIITEACNGAGRRVDLVDLTEDCEYEIETTEKRAQRFKGTEVFVIALWEGGKNGVVR